MRDVCVGSLSLVVPVIFQEEVNCGFDGVKEGCLPLCGVSSWRFSSFLLVVCASEYYYICAGEVGNCRLCTVTMNNLNILLPSSI